MWFWLLIYVYFQFMISGIIYLVLWIIKFVYFTKKTYIKTATTIVLFSVHKISNMSSGANPGDLSPQVVALETGERRVADN